MKMVFAFGEYHHHLLHLYLLSLSRKRESKTERETPHLDGSVGCHANWSPRQMSLRYFGRLTGYRQIDAQISLRLFGRGETS